MEDLFQPAPHASTKGRVLKFMIVALLIVAAIVLYFAFRYYPEQRATQHFFNALIAGDFNTAYKLWHPSPSYQMRDFMADWGQYGYYGPVKSYRIVRMRTPEGSANSVAVEVAVSPFSPMPEERDVEKSRRTRIVTIWVNTQDKSLSFPP